LNLEVTIKQKTTTKSRTKTQQTEAYVAVLFYNKMYWR